MSLDQVRRARRRRIQRTCPAWAGGGTELGGVKLRAMAARPAASANPGGNSTNIPLQPGGRQFMCVWRVATIRQSPSAQSAELPQQGLPDGAACAARRKRRTSLASANVTH